MIVPDYEGIVNNNDGEDSSNKDCEPAVKYLRDSPCYSPWPEANWFLASSTLSYLAWSSTSSTSSTSSLKSTTSPFSSTSIKILHPFQVEGYLTASPWKLGGPLHSTWCAHTQLEPVGASSPSGSTSSHLQAYWSALFLQLIWSKYNLVNVSSSYVHK